MPCSFGLQIGGFLSNTKVGAMSPLTRAPERGIAADSCRLEARPYPYSGGEHAMDRTMFRDLQQSTALFFGELPDERERHVDLLGAFGPRTHESDSYPAQRPVLSLWLRRPGHAPSR